MCYNKYNTADSNPDPEQAVLTILEAELEEYGRTLAAAVITEKRAHNFDKVVEEWKADDLMAELDASRSNARNTSGIVLRLRWRSCRQAGRGTRTEDQEVQEAEAEEMAALDLAKFHKAQQELEAGGDRGQTTPDITDYEKACWKYLTRTLYLSFILKIF